MSRAFWLASYPKSGNTWFRLMIASFRRESAVDINDLSQPRGMASGRDWFDQVMLFPSGLLTHEECDRMRPLVYAAKEVVAGGPEIEEIWTRTEGAQFVKTHDAYTYTDEGRSMMGGREAAEGVVLIVRDPRDICASIANHNNVTLDQAIHFMGHAESHFCGERDRQPLQLRQQLLGWSAWYASWLDQAEVPVHLVRYEDMQADAVGALRDGLAFAGIAATDEELAHAVAGADFEDLKRREVEGGFREAPRSARAGFFRNGVSGGWKGELDAAQVARIEREHLPMMRRFGYEPVTQGEQ